MTTRTFVSVVATSALLVAALVLAVVLSNQMQARHRPSATGRVSPARTSPPPPALPRQVPTASRSRPLAERSSTPVRVARGFLSGWLACVYHQTPCSQIAGMLPAYAVAFSRQQGSALPTPAELAARPDILTVQLLRGCAQGAVAVGTYQDGEGGRFDLHINLVREPAGWLVFDVAETPPHISLPRPLTHSPQGC